MSDWLRSSWLWLLIRVSRRMGVRASLFALVSVLGALLAPLVTPLLPAGFAERLGTDAVGDILGILASSMLVVATFSLGTLISAFAVASSTTTPRVTELLMQDTSAQNAISVFLGAFLFALVGIIGLNAGFYSADGRVVLFAMTLGVVVIVVVTFVRWVDLLSHLGRVSDAVDRATAAALAALEERVSDPHIGGLPRAGDVLPEHRGHTRERIGYVCHVDLGALQQLAVARDGRIVLLTLPGAFVDPTRALVAADFAIDEETAATIEAAFDIDARRTLDLDPRYGLITLAEIGSKALSPGINDPGTAINVIAALTRVLAVTARETTRAPEVLHDRVMVTALTPEDLLADAFSAVARDGAGMVEVQVRLQKSLGVLLRLGDLRMARAAAEQSRHALAHARLRLELPQEIERIETLARSVETELAGRETA